MVNDALYDAVIFQLPELLNEHFLRDTRNCPLQIGEAKNPASEKMEQDHKFPSALEEFQSFFDTFRRGIPRVSMFLTFR